MKHYLFMLFGFFLVQAGAAQNKVYASLPELLQMAETNYPLLKSKANDVLAAKEAVNAGASSRIPSLDAAYQFNYGTYNNITGMNYPQLLIPISGPPSADNNYHGVFGSAASLLFNWQPVTFGQRQSQIDYAKAGLQHAQAEAGNEIFTHKVKLIQSYLDLLMATERVKVFEKNLQRTEAGLSMGKTLAVNGIKPGVDTALLKSEVSKAKVELLNSRKYKDQAAILLSRLLAVDEVEVAMDTSYFYRLPVLMNPSDSIKNPLLSLYSSDIELTRARKKMLSKTAMPTLGVWGTSFARGSGVDYTGTVKSTQGLEFQRLNYGAGAQISIPLLQTFRNNPQVKQQEYLIQSGTEKLNEVSLELKKQNELADAAIRNAMAVAGESPSFYESAAFSYRSLFSRYQSGLANFADLIQSQYLLVKAELEKKESYMDAWRSLLYKAAVNGDLNLFMNQVK